MPCEDLIGQEPLDGEQSDACPHVIRPDLVPARELDELVAFVDATVLTRHEVDHHGTVEIGDLSSHDATLRPITRLWNLGRGSAWGSFLRRSQELLVTLEPTEGERDER